MINAERLGRRATRSKLHVIVLDGVHFWRRPSCLFIGCNRLVRNGSHLGRLVGLIHAVSAELFVHVACAIDGVLLAIDTVVLRRLA